MKQPKVESLRRDSSETQRVRKSVAKSTTKITINLDAESLALLKHEAEMTGTPYQRILNQVLRDGLVNRKSAEARLKRLEHEIALMKKKLMA